VIFQIRLNWASLEYLCFVCLFVHSSAYYY